MIAKIIKKKWYDGPRMARNIPEQLEVSRENLLTNFFLWLAMVNLTVTASEDVLAAAQTHFQKPDATAIISFAPHTGHTDSLFAHEAINRLLPQVIGHHMFVSAKDTWGNDPLKLAFAETLIGSFHQFDRDAKLKELVAEINKLKARLTTEHKSLIFYPQGGRTLGLPIATTPVLLARRSERPIVVFNISDDAQEVLPKVAGKESARNFIFSRIMRRARYALTAEHNFDVTVNLEDFIPPDLPEAEMKTRFLTAHHANEKGQLLTSDSLQRSA